MDGCPLVELQDTAADVEHLLKALYDPALFHQKAISFPYIASFVRLGRKYDFKVLFDIAVERLAFESPTTLKEYDSLFDALKETSSGTTKIVPYGGIYRDILTLLRENGLQKMLPCAYLRLSKQTMDSIFGERLRPDGTLCALSPIDHRVCGVGRERLLETQWKTGNTLGWIITWKPAGGCKDRYQCRKSIKEFCNTFLLKPSVCAFRQLNELQDSLCDACAELAETAITTGRAKMWENLPSFFDLHPWSELKNSNEM